MPYPANSRYYNIEVLTYEGSDGRTIKYLKRRFCPPPERFVALQEHVVAQGDRLDNLAAHYLGDPEQSWRVADANRAQNPEALCAKPEKRLRITLPEGIPGGPLV